MILKNKLKADYKFYDKVQIFSIPDKNFPALHTNKVFKTQAKRFSYLILKIYLKSISKLKLKSLQTARSAFYQ